MMATRAAAFPLAVVVGILVARILGPTDRGIFSVLMLTGATILPVLQFGIPAGIRFHIANGNYQSKQVLVTATGIAVILGTLTLLVVALAWNSGWLGSVEEMPGWLVWPVLLSLPAQAVTLMLRQLMIGSSWFATLNTMTILSALSTPLLLAVFVLVAGLGLKGAMITIVSRNVLLCLAYLWVVVAKGGIVWSVRLGLIIASFTYGLKSWVGGISGKANMQLDQVLLAVVGSKADLGIYAMAVRIANTVQTSLHPVILVMYNRIAETKNVDQSAELTERLHRMLVAVTGLIALALGVLAVPIIRYLLGESWLGAATVMQILVPGMVGIVSFRVLSIYFSATNRPGISSAVQTLTLVITLTGLALLVPLYGIIGAAITSTFAYTTSALVMYVIYRRDRRELAGGLFLLTGDDIAWLATRVNFQI